VYAAEFVGGEYWIIADAPEVPSDDLHDLRVSLCGSVFDERTDAVLYQPYEAAHMLAIDISESMNIPMTGTSKLEAALAAASL